MLVLSDFSASNQIAIYSVSCVSISPCAMQLYDKTLEIKSFKILEDTDDFDLNAEAGSTFPLTETSSVTIIDPFDEYVACLNECFDFDALKEFVKRDDFSVLFDGMHGAGGPFARRVFLEELGLPEVSLMRQFAYYSLDCLVLTCSCQNSRHCCGAIHFQTLVCATRIPT